MIIQNIDSWLNVHCANNLAFGRKIFKQINCSYNIR